MNEKGFVQIKVLTIVFITGIICFTLIPYLLENYNIGLKKEYVEIAKKSIKKVKKSINSLDYSQMPEKNEGLLVRLSNLDIKKSPYGKFKDEYSYVIAINLGDYYEYYFASLDSNNWGIPVVSEKELNVDSIVFGKSKLTNVVKSTSIDSIYISGTIFEESKDDKENDDNILLVPVTGDLTVSYEFKKDVHKIYDKLIKEVDTSVYNKEATINNGVLKYDNKEISSGYLGDINGFFRYISFPNNGDNLYYSSFVNYNKSYVAGIINRSDDYTTNDIVFDSKPTIVINKDAKVVKENDKKYLMWNLMAIYPDNSNYTVTECGALIVKNNNATEVIIDSNTRGALIGKSNNNCELGNIFAIRKTDVKTNERYFARGYIKYHDKKGNYYTIYSKDTISSLVK